MTRWQSVLPRLGYSLPPDRIPATAGPLSPSVPLELVRQSVSGKEFWEIPEPVWEEYQRYRPTPLWRARRFERAVGARAAMYVKYEGGNISGSHKMNTALAQAYYYKRAGVTELVTGTGAGQWGTALAAACAAFGLSCTVFMVGTSLRDKPYRGTLMRLLGAQVHASPSTLTTVAAQGSGNSLALAIGEAVEYARTGTGRAFCIGSGENYSILHQSVIGREAIEQLDAPVDTVVGCVGAGSNFGGIALPFFAEDGPVLLAVESSSTPKLTRGVYAYDITDATGTAPMEAMYTVGARYPIPPAHAGGLRFHGTAKLLSAMRHHNQIAATAVGQQAALEAGHLFATTELVVPAPESGHALAAAAEVAARGRSVLVCLSGHGLLDLSAYEQLLAGRLHDIDADQKAIDQATAGLDLVGHDLAEVNR